MARSRGWNSVQAEAVRSTCMAFVRVRVWLSSLSGLGMPGASKVRVTCEGENKPPNASAPKYTLTATPRVGPAPNLTQSARPTWAERLFARGGRRVIYEKDTGGRSRICRVVGRSAIPVIATSSQSQTKKRRNSRSSSRRRRARNVGIGAAGGAAGGAILGRGRGWRQAGARL
jgi:hypothetical protein